MQQNAIQSEERACYWHTNSKEESYNRMLSKRNQAEKNTYYILFYIKFRNKQNLLYGVQFSSVKRSRGQVMIVLD